MEELDKKTMEQLNQGCECLRSEIDIILRALHQVPLDKMEDEYVKTRIKKLNTLKNQFKDLGNFYLINWLVDELLNFLEIDKFAVSDLKTEELKLEIDLIGAKYPEYYEEICEKDDTNPYFNSNNFSLHFQFLMIFVFLTQRIFFKNSANFFFLDLKHNSELIYLGASENENTDIQYSTKTSQLMKSFLIEKEIFEYPKSIQAAYNPKPSHQEDLTQCINQNQDDDSLNKKLFTGNKTPKQKSGKKCLMIGVTSSKPKSKAVGRKIRNLGLENYVLNFIKQTIIETSKSHFSL